MVIAVDFDGCLCKNLWPEIGEPNVPLIEDPVKIRKDGARIVLWTCREGELLEKAVNWCRERGLEFDAVNDNTEEQKAHFGNNCRKVGADMYIDDKAVRIAAGTRGAALEMEGEAREPEEIMILGYPVVDGKAIGYRYHGEPVSIWRKFMPRMRRRKW